MIKRAETRQVAFLAAAALFAALLLGVPPVFAGFVWKGGETAMPGRPAAQKPQTDAVPLFPAMPAHKLAPIESQPLPLRGNASSSLNGKASAAPARSSGKPAALSAAQSAEYVSGFGDGLPLSLALDQIVPPTYKTVLAPGVSGDTKVSWRGDRPWKDVLNETLAGAGLVASIDGTTVTVRSEIDLGESKGTPLPLAPPALSDSEKAAAPAAHEAPAPSHSFPLVSWQQDAVSAAAAGPLPPVASGARTVSSWPAQKGETLHAVLTAWCKAAGVDLYWSTDYDYRVEQGVTFTGDFAGAVKKLLERFAAAQPQPYGALHKNPAGADVLVINIYYTPN